MVKLDFGFTIKQTSHINKTDQGNYLLHYNNGLLFMTQDFAKLLYIKRKKHYKNDAI